MPPPYGFDLTREPELSYSYREEGAQVWWNRIGVTSALFGVCMSAAYLFGRPRD